MDVLNKYNETSNLLWPRDNHKYKDKKTSVIRAKEIERELNLQEVRIDEEIPVINPIPPWIGNKININMDLDINIKKNIPENI